VKIKHLRKREEFAAIVQGGRKARGGAISVYIGPDGPEEELSVGIIIPKKSIPKAVTRNYLRRVIYAYFQSDGRKWDKGEKVVVRVGAFGKIAGKRAMSREVREELDRMASGNSRAK